MAVRVQVTAVSVAPSGGPISVTYSFTLDVGGPNEVVVPGLGWNATSLQAFKDLTLPGAVDVSNEQGLLKYLLQRWLARSADLSNDGFITGRRVTFDPTANNGLLEQ